MSNFKQIIMEPELSLSFFAQLIKAETEDLDYAIVTRKYNDGHTTMHPCLTVLGIKNYVFDIIEGQFVFLGKRSDSSVKKEKAFIVKDEKGLLFRTTRGHSIPYTEREFKKLYCFRVVNPVLFH